MVPRGSVGVRVGDGEGVATVEADLTGLSGGSGLESLVAGTYTLDGVNYGYRSLPRLVTAAAGSTSYSLLVADLDGNSGHEGDYPVTVAAGTPVSAVFLTGLEQGVASSSAPGVFAAVVGGGVSADAHDQHHGSEASKADFSSAEVRRVDKDAQKVTLRHGPIPNLGMGDMQMVFRVTDPRMLDDLKPGDRIRFKADKVGGQYTVTELEIAK